jgi:hypothetical protein
MTPDETPRLWSVRGSGEQPNAITAEEAIAQRDELLRSDPEYRAAAEAVGRERQEQVRLLREAEAPIVGDLRRAGLGVSSVWDLVNTSEPYPTALPVLLAHLERGGYPDAVIEGLGRALAVKPSAAQWDILSDLYLQARSPGEKEGLAVALAAAATSEHFDQLVKLLLDERQGRTRIYFVRTVTDVGGQRGREVLAKLADNPVLGREVHAVLKLT